MKKKYLISYLLVVMLPLVLLGQNEGSFPGLYLSSGSLNESSIRDALKSSRMSSAYSNADWQKRIQEVQELNASLERRITEFKTRRSAYANKRQQLLANQDISGLVKQLEDKRKSLKTLPEQVQQSLNQIGLRGSYLCVIPSLGLFSDISENQVACQKGMSGYAVPELNGVFLRSVTEVENGLLESRVIQQWVSGKLSIQGSPFYSSLSANQKYYILGALVEVMPLQKNGDGKGTGHEGVSPLLVLNMQEGEGAVRQKLSQAGLATTEIQKILDGYRSMVNATDVEQYNARKREEVQEINREAKRTGERLRLDISELEDKIKRHERLIAEMQKSFNLAAGTGGVEEKVAQIKNYIQKGMKECEDSISLLVSKKYEQAENSFIVAGDLASDMARTAMGVMSQLKARSSVMGYTQYVEVKSGMVVNYQEGKEVIFKRELAEIWLMPIAGEYNTYKMGLIARYKVTKLDGGSYDNIETETGCTNCTEAQRKVVEVIASNMVSIPGGSFMMGCTEGDNECHESEKPRHLVKLSSFKISKFEVTQSQWKAIMGESVKERWYKINSKIYHGVNPWEFYESEGEGADYPMYSINWEEAQLFIQKLGQLTGIQFRLPTEAEWEYAALGGNSKKNYSGSNSIENVAWYEENSGGSPHPVGQKDPNGYGLYDMIGNVWEWCEDWYDDEYYKKCNSENGYIDPKGPLSPAVEMNDGDSRVLKGGSYGMSLKACRISARNYHAPVLFKNNSNIGFRLAQD